MNEAAEYISGARSTGLLLIADHASSRVPGDIDLEIDEALLQEHIAVDIGVDALSRDVAARLGCPAILARVSRLVVDLHRTADESAAIPVISDGHAIPGNASLNDSARVARIDRFWRPYHALIDERVGTLKPKMLFALHSFTPQLRTRPDETRPWQIGILYNRDDRASRLAIAALRGRGISTGDNQPYSGKLLNATMDRHAERRGIPYLVFEVRQDLISDADGVAWWGEFLAPIIAEVRDAL